MRLSVVCCLLLRAYALVEEVTDKTVAKHLGKNIPTILTLYAEWCSHCKTFAPSFDDLAKEFAHLDDKIQFLRIDGDKNRKTSNSFGLKYFPTVMFVDGDHSEEIDRRDVASLKEFIAEKTGLTPESAISDSKPKVSRQSMESKIVELIDDTFEDGIDGKDAMVAFTTEWCHFCRKLQPEWEELAKLYSEDEDVAIVNVDCTDMNVVKNLVDTFDIDGFPTIIHFPSDPKKGPALYQGARSLDGFVDYLKKEGVSSRQKDGKLGKDAGVIKDLELNGLKDIKALINAVEESGSKFSGVYHTVLEKLEANKNYLETELARLEKILESTLSSADADKFQIKSNILRSLQSGDQRDLKQEL